MFAFLTITLAMLTLSNVVLKPTHTLGLHSSSGFAQPEHRSGFRRHALCVGREIVLRGIDASRCRDGRWAPTTATSTIVRSCLSFVATIVSVTTVVCPLKIPPDASSDLPFPTQHLLAA